MAVPERLARAKAYLAIAESKDAKREAYKRAAEEIAAHREETRATWGALAISLKRSEATLRKIDQWRRSGYSADTPFLADAEATKRAARSHAKAALADPSEAAKIIADLPPETRATVAKAVADNPSMRRAVEDEEASRQSRGRVDITEPSFPLLHRIESDRVDLKRVAERMVGHWHDGRHGCGEAELELVRDSMAKGVIEVEQIVTGALRTTDDVEVT